MKRMRSKDRVIEELNGEYSSVMKRKPVMLAFYLMLTVFIGVGIYFASKFGAYIDSASPFLIAKIKAHAEIGLLVVVCLGVCYWTGRKYLNRNH